MASVHVEKLDWLLTQVLFLVEANIKMYIDAQEGREGIQKT